MKGSSWPFAPSGITARPIRPESGLSDDDDDDFLARLPFFPLWISSPSLPLPFSLYVSWPGFEKYVGSGVSPTALKKIIYRNYSTRNRTRETPPRYAFMRSPLLWSILRHVKGGEGWEKKKKKKKVKKKKEGGGKISSSFVGGSSVTHDRQQRNHSWRRAPRPFFRFARDRLFLSLFAFIETCDSLLCRLCEIIGGRERLRLWFQRGAFWIYPPFFSRYRILGNVRLATDASLISRYTALNIRLKVKIFQIGRYQSFSISFFHFI